MPKLVVVDWEWPFYARCKTPEVDPPAHAWRLRRVRATARLVCCPCALATRIGQRASAKWPTAVDLCAKASRSIAALPLTHELVAVATDMCYSTVVSTRHGSRTLSKCHINWCPKHNPSPSHSHAYAQTVATAGPIVWLCGLSQASTAFCSLAGPHANGGLRGPALARPGSL
eukprot:439520-Prymnesium_polylepis.1